MDKKQNLFACNKANQNIQENIKPVVSAMPSYEDLVEALKYAHRFAKQNDGYDVDYIQDIIDKIK